MSVGVMKDYKLKRRTGGGKYPEDIYVPSHVDDSLRVPSTISFSPNF
jgi:hypothetical protein